ncbi:MAG: hypothetical protein HFI90_08170 [Clostridia bacterium]|nr:hypothetical protein [Clostridia bacterium]
MQSAIAYAAIFLFCLFHLPALSALQSYRLSEPNYGTRHLWLGCFLYLFVSIIIYALIAEILLLFLPEYLLFLFAIIPAALLFGLPKNYMAANCRICQMPAGPPIIATVTYLFSTCGEICSLLLFLPLTVQSDIVFYPYLLLGFATIIFVSRLFSVFRLQEKKIFFLLQFCGYLCFFVLFLLLSPTSFSSLFCF